MKHIPADYLKGLLKSPLDDDFQQQIANCLWLSSIDARGIIDNENDDDMMRFNAASSVGAHLHKHIKKKISCGELPLELIEYRAGAPYHSLRPCVKYRLGNLMIYVKKTDSPSECPLDAQIRRCAATSNQRLLFDDDPIFESPEVNIFLTYGMQKLQPAFLSIGIPGDGISQKWVERYDLNDALNFVDLRQPEESTVEVMPKIKTGEIKKASE